MPQVERAWLEDRDQRRLRVAFGVTIVELLVVVSIIAVLAALLLPAIQLAREAARRSSCANNLRQLVLGVKTHADTQGFVPTGGWGGDWLGDPDAGFGTKQPGGWIYNVLPFIEGQAVRDLGKGSSGAIRHDAIARLAQSPLDVAHCPTRRGADLYPYYGPARLRNALPPGSVAKSDYAISGTISFEKSDLILSEIQMDRGLSKTIFLGEKVVDESHYTDGQADGDRLVMYVGDSQDIRRQVGAPSFDRTPAGGFGSAHPGGCHFAFGDGSVRFVGFDESWTNSLE